MSRTESRPKAVPDSSATVGDIMNTPVVWVSPDTTVEEAAGLLLEKRISAAPVVGQGGDLIGMVSEGDLLGRSEQERLTRRDWWLALVAAGGQATSSFPVRELNQPVENIMHAPVITIAADASIQQAADMLLTHRIKRLPVLQNGKVVGIISRADLLRVVTAIRPSSGSGRSTEGLVGLIAGLLSSVNTMEGAHQALPLQTTPEVPVPVTAQAFRHLVEQSEQATIDEKQRAAAEVVLQRHRQVKALLQARLDDEMWATLLTHARGAAAHGEHEFPLLQFPSDLCSDGGRKIDVAEAGWETTLRGEAADLYDRWERELKSAGFGLSARILNYPGGKPGDIGLFLVWQQ